MQLTFKVCNKLEHLIIHACPLSELIHVHLWFYGEDIDSKHMSSILLDKIPETSGNRPWHTLELSAFSCPGIPAEILSTLYFKFNI